MVVESPRVTSVPKLVPERVWLFVRLTRVALRHDEFTVERKGKPVAALVSVERLEQMRRFARRHALDLMEQQKGGALTDDQAMALGLEAQRWARQRKRKPRIKTR